MHFQYKDVLRVKRQHEHQAEEERRAHRQVVDTGLHFNMVSTVAIACALLTGAQRKLRHGREGTDGTGKPSGGNDA